MVPSQVRGMILQVPRQLDRGVRVTEPQLVQVRCPKCGRLGALANAPPAPPTWRCNGCRGRGDPEGCRNARRAVAAYRSGHYRGEATLKSMLQSAIKRGMGNGAMGPLVLDYDICH